jgi:hypothetical protein
VATRVVWDSHFPAFKLHVEEAVIHSLHESVRDGAVVAKAEAPKATGRMAADTHESHAWRSQRGFSAQISAPGPARWQEMGTRGRRTKRLRGTTAAEHRAHRQTLNADGATGIKPHRFLLHGLKAAVLRWPGHMKRAM